MVCVIVRKVQAWGTGRGWPEEGESLGEAIHGENGDGGGASRRSRWKRNERGRKVLGCALEWVCMHVLCVQVEREAERGWAKREAARAEETTRGRATVGQWTRRPRGRRSDGGVDWGGEPSATSIGEEVSARIARARRKLNQRPTGPTRQACSELRARFIGRVLRKCELWQPLLI